MSIATAKAKLLNKKRIIYKGRGMKLQIVEQTRGTDDYTVICDVKTWDIIALNPLVVGSEQYEIKIVEDSEATAERIRRHIFAVNGEIHQVKSRHEPIGFEDRMWRIRTEPGGENI